MITLPPRFARCARPIPRTDRPNGDLIPSEESASLWLWAFPRLLGWPRRVNWLFSPVVGNTTYPGDVWGVDSAGHLLVVETKLARTGRGQDPFADIVEYAGSKHQADLCQGASLEPSWHQLAERERLFLRRHLDQLRPDVPLTSSYPGVVPYSSHREAVWRWQALLRARVAPLLLSDRYRHAVRRGLRMRRASGDPPPIFVGLIAVAGTVRPRLSTKGQANLASLRRRVGPGRLALRAVGLEPSGEGLLIRSWAPFER